MVDLAANKDILRNAVQALGDLRVDDFLALLTDDVAFETPVRHRLFAGPKTKADLRAELGMMKSILPSGVPLTIETMTAEDDRVHAEITGEARTVDGGEYNNRYHYAVVIRDGRIASLRDYFDSHYAIAALEQAAGAR